MNSPRPNDARDIHACCDALGPQQLRDHRDQLLSEAGTSWDGLLTRATYFSLTPAQDALVKHVERIDELLGNHSRRKPSREE